MQVWIARKGFEDDEKGMVKGELKRLRKNEKQGCRGAGRENEQFEYIPKYECVYIEKIRPKENMHVFSLCKCTARAQKGRKQKRLLPKRTSSVLLHPLLSLLRIALQKKASKE